MNPAMKIFNVIVATCFVAILASGCLPMLERKMPVRNEYYLTIDRGKHEVGNRLTDSHLVVRPFRISPAFDRRSFVHRKPGNRLESDFHNLFFTAPAPMITSETRRWIEASGRFDYVSGISSMNLGRYILEGKIAALYIDETSRPAAAVMELQLLLFDTTGTAPTPLIQKTYTAREEFASQRDGSHPAPTAWGTCLERILLDFEEDLVNLKWEPLDD